MSLFGLKQAENLLTRTDPDEPRGPAAKAFDEISHATQDQFGETLRSFFRMMDNVQRGAVSLAFSFLTPTVGKVEWTSEPPQHEVVIVGLGDAGRREHYGR